MTVTPHDATDEKISEAYGEGFEVDSIEDCVAVATRQVAITEVSHDDKAKTQQRIRNRHDADYSRDGLVVA